ncbi:MAG: hypothetical protein KA712_02740 [Myxococcales bacterium]|nr:hypothetical protein [Myxococcales bacterium]
MKKHLRIGLAVSAMAFMGLTVSNCGGSDSTEDDGGDGDEGGSGGSVGGSGGKGGSGGSGSGGSSGKGGSGGSDGKGGSGTGGSGSGGSDGKGGSGSGGSGSGGSGSGGSDGKGGSGGSGGMGGMGGTAAGGMGGSNATGGMGGNAAASLTFKADIFPLLKMNCAGAQCHGNAFGQMTDTDAWNFVQGTTSKCEKYNGKKRVEPMMPGDSILLSKITGGSTLLPMGCGNRMPAGGRDPLDATEIAKVEQWIQQGAKRE